MSTTPEEEVDVLVIGSGASGAPLTSMLVNAGRQVLVVEKGPLLRSHLEHLADSLETRHVREPLAAPERPTSGADLEVGMVHRCGKDPRSSTMRHPPTWGERAARWVRRPRSAVSSCGRRSSRSDWRWNRSDDRRRNVERRAGCGASCWPAAVAPVTASGGAGGDRTHDPGIMSPLL